MAALIALILCVMYDAVTFGLGSLVLRVRTGSWGWVRSLGGSAPERLANLLFLLACGVDVGAPAAVLVGVLRPLNQLEHRGLHVAGAAVLALSIPAAVTAQLTMGRAWRTGIDRRNPGPLVVAGPFALVRNPFYSSTAAASLGVALLVPTVLAPLAVGSCIVALEVQTRLVEEPFLRSRHGASYRSYAERVGRFVPGVGRLRQQAGP